MELLGAEKAILKKQDGREIEITASIQSQKIYVRDVTIPFEEGDVIIQTLPSGIKKQYKIIDTICYANSSLAHWELTFEKMINRQDRVASSIVNMQAEKIYLNSIDNSVNKQPDEETLVIFNDIRNTLQKGIIGDKVIIEALDELIASVGSEKYPSKYAKFIQSAANHITIISPFIPFLSDLLNKK